MDSLGGILKRHENSNTKFSLLHKFFRLRLGTMWDEMHFVNIGKGGLNPVLNSDFHRVLQESIYSFLLYPQSL